jgi:sugar lactone lactonase YvrE
MGKQSTNNPMRAPSPVVRATLRDWALPRILVALAMAPAFANPTLAQTQTTLTSLILPSALVFDPAGNLYFAETGSHVIRKFTPAGVLTTVAGTGVQGFSGDGGLAIAATLDSPQGLALDSSNNLYIADTNNHRVRRIAANGMIATVAGTGAPGFSGDGAVATSAALDRPTALTLDSLGNLYVADANNHRIRRISEATGIISTIAGNGIQGFSGDNGPATLAAIDSPCGLAVDSANNLYLADTHNSRIRRVDAATAVITTVAGTGTPGFSGDNGLAIAATVALPRGLALDPAGNLTLADTANHRIRLVSTAGIISTIAGNGIQTFAGDGGPATAASLDSPRAVTLSPASPNSPGLATLSDTGNQRIRQIDASTIDTLTGISDFSLSATGASSKSIAAGSSVTYSFAVQFQGPALSNPIQLAVQGIPLGATPTFSPPQLPPTGVTAFTLAILTQKAELKPPPHAPQHGGPQPSLALALFSIVCFSVRSRLLGDRLFQRGRAPPLAAVSVLIALATITVGCGGNDIIALPEATGSNYTITVTGTATTPTGTQLQHSVNVTLQLVQ